MPIDIPGIIRDAWDLMEQARRSERCQQELRDLEEAHEAYKIDKPFYWQEIVAMGSAILLSIIAAVLGTPLVGLLVFSATGILIWIYTRDHRELRELRAQVVKMRSDLLRKCLGL